MENSDSVAIYHHEESDWESLWIAIEAEVLFKKLQKKNMELSSRTSQTEEVVKKAKANTNAVRKQ